MDATYHPNVFSVCLTYHNSSSTLMALLCDLLESSTNIQQQLIQNKGFLVISYLLEKVCGYDRKKKKRNKGTVKVNERKTKIK